MIVIRRRFKQTITFNNLQEKVCFNKYIISVHYIFDSFILDSLTRNSEGSPTQPIRFVCIVPELKVIAMYPTGLVQDYIK